jgi:WS/DGAT/MGAT family acyltransferase
LFGQRDAGGEDGSGIVEREDERLGLVEVTGLGRGDLDAYRRDRVGFVFQAFNLIPSLTAQENVAIPLILARTGRAEAMERAAAVLDRVGLADSGLDVPFTSPRTALNGPLTRARRFAGVSLELERLRNVARTTGTTLNDVVVAVCDIALRRYLSTHADSPREPLVAELPVNLRREGEGSVTNIIGIIPVRMAGVSRSPVKRLKEVHRSTGEMKDALSSLSRETVMAYTLIIQGAAVAADLFNLSGYFRPHGNILISNVPGSPVPLYLMGARLLEIYPISTIPPHMVMNITVFSYDGKLFFGLIGGYDAIPNLPDMPRYLLEAFEALEAEAAGEKPEPEAAAKPARARKPRAPRAAARKKTAARPAGKPRKKAASRKSAAPKDGR